VTDQTLAWHPLRPQLETGLAELELPLPPLAVDRLLAYLDLLVKWNGAYNLTAVRDPAQMVSRHLLDSLAVLPWLAGSRFADVGTGAGLPGIPLAIARPELQFDLYDSNGKKIRFVTQAVAALGLANVQARQARIENVHPETGYDGVLSRAFAALADMTQWCGHLLAPTGRLLALKGVYPADELAALPPGYTAEAVHRLAVPGADGERHLAIIAPAR
jgi:16S rRNA (guanine527-N7)-methyltransferase